MNKRIRSMILSVVMVLCMLVSAAPAYAAPVSVPTFSVEADKTTANPGDTITYSVYLQQPDTITCFAFFIDVPAGLTYVADSGKLGATASSMFGYTFEFVPENNLQVLWFSSSGDDITDTSKIELITFQCTVDADATVNQEYSISLRQVEVMTGSTQDYADISDTAEVVSDKVTVEPKPVAVTGVTIDETLSVKTGESKTPSYTINPAEATNKNVSFKSDNTEVATVNETTGEVTGVKEGTANITIITADGNFTDTCVVTVACSHANRSSVDEKASDCKDHGWDAYVECDDCGQLFNAEGGEISEIPFRPLSNQHTGGTATCVQQAICDICTNPYGDFADHSYTAEEKKAEALKSEGTCCENAVYYYSCAVCGQVEYNDNHTFLGDKVANNHVGGTALENQAEADHKTQTNGYTGDTRCLGCKEIIEYGQPILAGEHTPANVWSYDGEYHWKECTVVGCGIVIDGTKAEHSSTGENVATCQNAAVCDVCGVSYGTVADHDWNTSDWEKDEYGHWHKCNTAGCTEKDSYERHVGGTATCTEQAKCSVCGEPYGDLANHYYATEDKKAEALKEEGNCRDYAVYYYSCDFCGQVENNEQHTFLGDKVADVHVGGTVLENQAEADHKTQTDGYTGDIRCLGCDEIIEYGQPILAGEHIPANVWSTDGEYHWKECTVVGCGIVIDGSKAAHSSEKAENKAACEKQAVCDVCGVAYGDIPEHNYGDEIPEVPAEIGKDGLKAHYQCSECEKYFVDEYFDTHVAKKEVSYEELIIPALIDEEYTFEIPFSVIVEKTGDLDPAEETFTFEIFDLGYEDAIFTVEGLTVDTNGVNTYTGKLVIKVKESQFYNLSEGFKFAQVKGESEGWTYDEAVYYIAPYMNNFGEIDFIIFPGDDAWGNTVLEKAEFTNSYNKAKEPVQPDDNEDNKPTDDNKPSDEPQTGEDNKPSDSPQTGDNSNMVLWFSLLMLSALGVIATIISGKKRFVK